MIALSDYLILAALLFSLSVAGIFLNRKNIIILLMCIELMLLAVNLNFIAFSHFLGDAAGQVFVFFILTVAAAVAWRFWWCCFGIYVRLMSMISISSGASR